ncbi:unnamed protein product [Periconia digitata]|uniref:Uncharacterized protein n=1 Tax=Periconia digitata TaxID=1303443 RepID=A0A9W4XQQ6_9PLEO|nr:unnamed protein product [Periconia digitata]
MASYTAYTFTTPSKNTIKYLFNPSKREAEGEGPVVLDQLIETYDSDSDSDIPTSPTPSEEPKPGTVLLRYVARDGGDVRYIYDPTARNGKQYVVAIHREPENWQRLKEEDLGVADEHRLGRMYERYDGGLAGEEHEVVEEQEEQRTWAREREEAARGSKRRDSMVDDGIRMDVDVE